MVHFGAKVTNAVHHHWFSGGYSEKTDSRLIKFLSQFGQGVVESAKPTHNYGPVKHSTYQAADSQIISLYQLP